MQHSGESSGLREAIRVAVQHEGESSAAPVDHPPINELMQSVVRTVGDLELVMGQPENNPSIVEGFSSHLPPRNRAIVQSLRALWQRQCQKKGPSTGQ
jgi:hypothetical protein